MKVRSRASSSNLFLIELIIAILFFSVASAVCVQIFVKSHRLSNDSTALSAAVDECSAAAEIITTSDSIGDAKAGISKVWEDSLREGGHFLIYFNDEFTHCRQTASNSAYVMEVSLKNHRGMLSSHIEMTDMQDEESVYSLRVKHYLQKGGGDE